jgi:hypothetical protein
MAVNLSYNILTAETITNMAHIPYADSVMVSELVFSSGMRKLVGHANKISWNNLFIDYPGGNVADIITTLVDGVCNTCNKVVIDKLHLPKSYIPKNFQLTPPFDSLIFCGSYLKEILDFNILEAKMKKMFGTKSVAINSIHIS